MSKKKQPTFKFEAGTRIDFKVKGLTAHGVIRQRYRDEDGNAVYRVHNPSTSNPAFTYAMVNEANIVATYSPVVVSQADTQPKKQATKRKAAKKQAVSSQANTEATASTSLAS